MKNDRPCSIKGCLNHAFARGMCRAHYHRHRRHGTHYNMGNGSERQQLEKISRQNGLEKARKLYDLASNLETRKKWKQTIRELENDARTEGNAETKAAIR